MENPSKAQRDSGLKFKVLVLDDEENLRKILSSMLKISGHTVVACSRISEAKEKISAGDIEVVLTDMKLDREDGLQLLKWVKEERLPIPIIVLTAHGTVDTAVDAMKQGAFDYLSKPFERSELIKTVEKAGLTFRFQKHSVLGAVAGGSLFPMIGDSPQMRKIYSILEKVAPSDSNVLIMGESGTGKELIAQSLHELSPRKNESFIKINCAAIPETLMESELFGYERGAFTGAVGSKPGRFELADNGTLFLDEIGDMSTEMQVKLLRVLQERTFERIGGIRTLKVNVRLVTATNKNLEEAVQSGTFRKDLYYRLNVVPISLPPLRSRAEDIPHLVASFVNKFCEQMKKTVPTLSPETLELLMQYRWPGNIRQLENVIERILVLDETGHITPDQLPEEIMEFEEERFLQEQINSGSLKEIVKDATRKIEKKAIEEALSETENNVTQAARKLNISRKGLQLKMKELGLR